MVPSLVCVAEQLLDYWVEELVLLPALVLLEFVLALALALALSSVQSNAQEYP
jgi:hypothetical protein